MHCYKRLTIGSSASSVYKDHLAQILHNESAVDQVICGMWICGLSSDMWFVESK